MRSNEFDCGKGVIGSLMVYMFQLMVVSMFLFLGNLAL